MPMNNSYPGLWRKLFSGGLGILTLRAVIMAASIVTTVMLVRYLGSRSFGIYSATLNIYGVFLGITLFGFGNIITREVAKRPARAGKYLINAAYAGALLASITTLGCLLFIHVVGYEPEVRSAVMLLIIALWPQFLTTGSEALLIALGRIRFYVAVSMIGSFIEIGIVLAATHWGWPLPVIIGLMAGNRCLSALLSLMVVLHYVPVVHFRPNVPFLIVLVKKSSVFSLAGIVTSVLLRLDILFLTKLRGVEATGIYAAAFKLVNPWTTVIASFTGIFYPLVSRHRRETSPEEFQKTCERYCRMVVLVAALAALFMICLSKELVLLLFRTAFADSAGVLTYLSFLLIPMCATPAFGMILAVGDKQKYDLLAIAVATGAACLLHYLLVRSFSYYGTVTAVILSFTIIMVIQVYFIRQEMFALRIGDVLLKPLAVFLIGLAVNQLMREISGWIKAPVVLSAALSAAIGLGLIKGREIQMIFKKKLSELGA